MITNDELKWSYLAGLIDGEGCISLSYKKAYGEAYTRVLKQPSNQHPYDWFSLRITIANTNFNLMQWLISNFGGNYYQKRKETSKHKAAYEWRTKGKVNTKYLLEKIRPYMLIKLGQTDVALEYLNMSERGERNPVKRKQLFLFCQFLNRKGPSPTTNTSSAPKG